MWTIEFTIRVTKIVGIISCDDDIRGSIVLEDEKELEPWKKAVESLNKTS